MINNTINIILFIIVILLLFLNIKKEHLITNIKKEHLITNINPTCSDDYDNKVIELGNISNLYNNKNAMQYDNVNVTNNLKTSIFNSKDMKGIIVAWSGTIDNIPIGWGFCDGTTYKDLSGNNIKSPDLRSGFIIGASKPNTPSTGKIGQPSIPFVAWLTPYQVGNFGGFESYQLELDEIPSHSHLTNVTGGACAPSNPNNVLSLYANSYNAGCWPNYTGYAGNSDEHNNLPPYIALAYIIKIW